jgi:hypothetical protein
MRRRQFLSGCHSGVPQSGEPGIHTHGCGVWIPDCLALLGIRNDDKSMESRS